MESAFIRAAMLFCAEPSVFQNPRWAITWVCAETLYAEKSKAEASRSFFIFIYFSFWFAFKDIKSNANELWKDANLR